MIKRRVFSLAVALGLLTVALGGFSSIYGGLVGSLAGGQFGTVWGGAVGSLAGGQFGTVWNGAAGTLAGGQFASIFSSAGSTPLAFKQSCHQNSGAGKSASNACTLTVTGGDLILMVAVSSGSGVANADNSGCADNNGGTYVFVQLSNTAKPTKICSAANHAGGSTTFTYTNQATDWSAVDVIEISGAATSNVLDQLAKNGSFGAANATTGTTPATTHAVDIAVTTLNNGVQGAMTCPAGYTQIDQVDTFNTDVSYCTCYLVLSATGAQSGTYTSPSAAWDATIQVFKGP